MRVARDGRLRPLDSVRGATSWPARSAAPQRSTRRTSTGRCPPPGRTETPQPRPAGAPPGPPALARRRLATARSGPARDADEPRRARSSSRALAGARARRRATSPGPPGDDRPPSMEAARPTMATERVQATAPETAPGPGNRMRESGPAPGRPGNDDGQAVQWTRPQPQNHHDRYFAFNIIAAEIFSHIPAPPSPCESTVGKTKNMVSCPKATPWPSAHLSCRGARHLTSECVGVTSRSTVPAPPSAAERTAQPGCDRTPRPPPA